MNISDANGFDIIWSYMLDRDNEKPGFFRKRASRTVIIGIRLRNVVFLQNQDTTLLCPYKISWTNSGFNRRLSQNTLKASG